jgi:RNAse (barnase) inhibitor barstar
VTDEWARSAGRAAPVQVIPLGDPAVTALCSLAVSLGMSAVRIDLAGCCDKESFLERTAEALEFPSWFGNNWDAFYDCLSDLGGRSDHGHLLVYANADDMRRDAPEALDTAIAILGDAAAAWERRGLPFRAFVGA